MLQVIDDISFSVDNGEIVSIIGPSGCGKTTLLRMVAGLETIDSGIVSVDGMQVTEPGPDRGFVFQTFGLFPWMTVKDNVEFGLFDEKISERNERSKYYIELVGLSGFEEYHPHLLSGGMQQRVGIARALAIEPKVLLIDEPLANVDAQTAERLVGDFVKVFRETQKTVLYVTHNMEEAIYVSDRVIVLSKRPSRIKEIITIDLPKERWQYDVKSTAEFGLLRAKLRQALDL